MSDKPAEEMTDEELAEAINPAEEKTEEVAPEADDTPDEEKTEDTSEKEEQVEPEQEEETLEEAPELSRRAQKRADDLEAKRLAGQQKFQEILDKRQPTRPAPSQPAPRYGLDYSQALDAEPEVIQQLEADRQQVAEAAYNRALDTMRAEMQSAQFENSIRQDLPLVTEKLSKLDPTEAEELDRDYLIFVGFDPSTGSVQHPNIRYGEYIDARLNQAERFASRMTAQTTKNIAKQAAQTGLRPDGSSAKRLNLNQAPENMTTEELYAVLGQTPPKK